jgi:hypothetical protein
MYVYVQTATKSAARKKNEQLSTRRDQTVNMYFISLKFMHELFKIFIVVGLTIKRATDSHPYRPDQTDADPPLKNTVLLEK